MRHFPYRIAAPLTLAGFVLCAAQLDGGRAGEAHSFIVAANDGYGIQDCLGEGGECGRVVADAWCQANGHGAALTFGRTDKVSLAATPGEGAEPYVVTCGD
ncbi:MAG TPA: hypothetical protein VEF36_13430 [Roseiarcus sp.]|nr:hypothetical protein [Roseiarcus sp.]